MASKKYDKVLSENTAMTLGKLFQLKFRGSECYMLSPYLREQKTV